MIFFICFPDRFHLTFDSNVSFKAVVSISRFVPTPYVPDVSFTAVSVSRNVPIRSLVHSRCYVLAAASSTDSATSSVQAGSIRPPVQRRFRLKRLVSPTL